MATQNVSEEQLQSQFTYIDAVARLLGDKRPKAYTHTFGCQQNEADTERIRGMLSEMGYEMTDTPDEADFILFNTCAVREHAEDRAFGNVGALRHLKKERPGIVIAMCGCMAQQEKNVEKIKKSYPQVNLLFGTHALWRFPSLLYRVLTEKKRVFDIGGEDDIAEGLPVLRAKGAKAWLSIMYGCNNFCTYCIVPYVRGRERSRKPESVIAEVKALVKNGYKEITLLGQNVNSYSYGFPELLRELDKIEGDFRIRFMSSHPKDASHELIDAILECKKVCKHLHLPVQAGSDRILKLMNRRYTTADYLKIIDYARSKDPEFSFTTDLIVGFPSETYEEFCETKELIKKVKYDNIYSFVYSRRSGTKAAEMEDHISDKQKGLWLRELLLEQREVSTAWLSRFVGRTVTVLPTGEGRTGADYLTGKSDEDMIVEVKADKKYIGKFIQVRITKAMNWALKGELVEDK